MSENLFRTTDEFKFVPEQRFPLIAHFGKIDDNIIKRVELKFKMDGSKYSIWWKGIELCSTKWRTRHVFPSVYSSFYII